MLKIKELIDCGAKISEIEDYIASASFEMYEEIIENLKFDSRKACSKISAQLEKKILSVQAEKERMFNMFSFEREAINQGYTLVAGIDEAGRGPLVGPVVAASVILNPDVDWSGINDSKKLSEKQREFFYDKIIKHAVSYGIGQSSHIEIDDINILNATKRAMKRAVDHMTGGIKPDYLLIDAVKLVDIDINQSNIIKGDLKSASIAAASIIAKVTRDRLLKTLDLSYPEYDFANNKGYGTDNHYNAIRKNGLIPEHRRSFLKGYV